MSVHTLIIFVLLGLAAIIVSSRATDESTLKNKQPAASRSADYSELAEFWDGLPEASKKVQKPWKYDKHRKNAETRLVGSFDSSEDEEPSSDLKIHRFDDFVVENLPSGRGKKQRRFAVEEEEVSTPEEPQHFVHSNYGHNHHGYDGSAKAGKVSLVDLIYRLLTLYGDIQKLVQAHPDKSIYENLQISIYEIIEELVHDKLPRMLQDMIAEMRSERTRSAAPGRSKKAVDEEFSEESDARASGYTGNSRNINDLRIARNIMGFFQRPRLTWWPRANALEAAGDKEARNSSPRENQESTSIEDFPNRYRIASIFPENARGNARPIDRTEDDARIIDERLYDQRYETIVQNPPIAPTQEMGDTDLNRNIYEQGFLAHHQWQNPMKRDTSLLAINYATGDGEAVIESPRVVRYAENARRPERSRRSEASKGFHEPAHSGGDEKIGESSERSGNVRKFQPAERLSGFVESAKLNVSVNPSEPKETARSGNSDGIGTLAGSEGSEETYEPLSSKKSPRFETSAGAEKPVNVEEFRQSGESTESVEQYESGDVWKLEDLVGPGNSDKSGRSSKSENSGKNAELPSSKESAKFNKPDGLVMSGESRQRHRSGGASKLGESMETKNSKTLANSEKSQGLYEPETSKGANKFGDLETGMEVEEKFQQSVRLARSVELEPENAPKFEGLTAPGNSDGTERSAKRENSTRKYQAMNSEKSTKHVESGESQKSEHIEKSQQSDGFVTSIKAAKLNESEKALKLQEPAKSGNSDASDRSVEFEDPKGNYEIVSSEECGKTAASEESGTSENVSKFQQSEGSAQSVKREKSNERIEAPELVQLPSWKNSNASKKLLESKDWKTNDDSASKPGEPGRAGNIQKIQPLGRSSRSPRSEESNESEEAPESRGSAGIENFGRLDESATHGAFVTPGTWYIPETSDQTEEVEEPEALSWSEKSKRSANSAKSDYVQAFEGSEMFSQPGESENLDKLGASRNKAGQPRSISLERLDDTRRDGDHVTEVEPRYVKVIESPPTTFTDGPL